MHWSQILCIAAREAIKNRSNNSRVFERKIETPKVSEQDKAVGIAGLVIGGIAILSSIFGNKK